MEWTSDESNGLNAIPRLMEPPVDVDYRQSFPPNSNFFDGIRSNDTSDARKICEKGVVRERMVSHHCHTNSVDGSSMMSFKADSSVAGGGVRKALSSDALAELVKTDPKKAKRIIANRQSAAKSKEKKIRYTNELERRVHMLQTESTNLSAELTMLHQDTAIMAAQNTELKLHVGALQQQSQFRADLKETMKEELHRLKMQTDHLDAIIGDHDNSFGGLFPQVSSQYAMHQLTIPPTQHQAQQQLQFQMPPPSFGLPFYGQCGPSFSNFNHQN